MTHGETKPSRRFSSLLPFRFLEDQINTSKSDRKGFCCPAEGLLGPVPPVPQTSSFIRTVTSFSLVF